MYSSDRSLHTDNRLQSVTVDQMLDNTQKQQVTGTMLTHVAAKDADINLIHPPRLSPSRLNVFLAAYFALGNTHWHATTFEELHQLSVSRTPDAKDAAAISGL